MRIDPRFMATLGAVLVLAALLPPSAGAGTGDGSVLSITKIQDNGPDTTRFNFVIMGDGYTTAEMATYEARAQQVVTAFNAEMTYGACGGAANFYRVNIVSDDSGSDKPAPCYSPAVSRDTYLDTHYCSGGTQRCIWSTNTALVHSTAAAATPNWHYVIVLVNDSEHGGCALSPLTFNATGLNFERTVLHEVGHALGPLGDEYTDLAGTYAGGEAALAGIANLTTETNRADVKWFDLIQATTLVPTYEWTSCASAAESPPAALEGLVGLFESGSRRSCSIYHPERSCLMRTLSADFCAVCNRRIRQVMSAHFSEGNLAVTPWGYFQSPKVHPYWQTPDVWADNDGDGVQESDEPLIGKPDNRLFARVTNSGTLPSGAFDVRFSYVPYTTVIDLAASQPIGTVSRPSLAASGTDVVEIPWPLDAVPPAFAGIDHFCVIVEILHDECATGDNQAQNNFVNVQTLSPAPAPLPFLIANVLDVDAVGALEVEPFPARPGWHIRANVPDLGHIPLAPRETKRIVLELDYRPTSQAEEPTVARPVAVTEVVEQDFDVTFRLEGQVLGGVSSRVRVVPAGGGRRSLSLHLGGAFPQGDFGDLYDGGPSVALDAGYRLTPRLSLVGLLGYHRLDAAVEGLSDTDLWTLSLGLQWDLLTGPMRPYLRAGPGAYVPESGSTEAGFNVGAGVDLDLAPSWVLELGADYHGASGIEPDLELLTAHVGAIYRF
jgi:hypothetical protein